MAPEVQVAAETPESVGFSRTVLTKPVLSWALYDLANTIFSMSMLSLYLPWWVVNVMGGTDATWGYTTQSCDGHGLPDCPDSWSPLGPGGTPSSVPHGVHAHLRCVVIVR